MRRASWLALLGLLIGSGCAADLGPEPNSADEDEAEGEVGRVDSALTTQCGLLDRRDNATGFVETLLCSGVACTRTCGNVAGTLLCSTKCETTSQRPAFAPLDLSILRPECRVDPNSRVDAGWPSTNLTKAVCESRGSCWDNRTRDPKFPFCYEPLGRQPTCGGVEEAANPAGRMEAGFPGISQEVCVRDRGGCWDARVRGAKFCYQPTPSTQVVTSTITPADPGGGTNPGQLCGLLIGPNPLQLSSGPTLDRTDYILGQGLQVATAVNGADPNCTVEAIVSSVEPPIMLSVPSPSRGRSVQVFAQDNPALDPQSRCIPNFTNGQVCNVSATVTYRLFAGLTFIGSAQGRINLAIFP